MTREEIRVYDIDELNELAQATAPTRVSLILDEATVDFLLSLRQNERSVNEDHVARLAESIEDEVLQTVGTLTVSGEELTDGRSAPTFNHSRTISKHAMPTPIDPKRIRTDLDTQSRIALNEETVKEYAEAMEAGAEFPAPLVFYDETNDLYILAEGFHRHASHMKVKPNDPILVELRLGTVEDARWASIGANKSHGLRRTNEDKRNAIKLAVTHPKGVEETDRGIAAHVGVDHKTVGNVRKELQASGEIPQIDTRTVYRGDQVYQQNTHGINFGRKTPPPGSTCATCRYFEQARCSFDGSEPVPWTAACDNFAVKVEDKPNSNFAPPDYDNIVISNEGDPDKKRKTTGRQNRKLAGCQLVPLPPDNAQLFAVELRNRFAPDYLVACFAALKTLLTDKES